jgi:large subunit ribosomal protein L4
MLVSVYNMGGEKVGETELADTVFAAPVNEDVMHQALVRQLANARLGTHQTKTRGLVAGGGRKPWRQKGTGRARQGSTRAPQWRKGGTVFGPHPRSYEQQMPRKMRQSAVRSALSVKAAADQIILLDALRMEQPKTKDMMNLLQSLGVQDSALILLPQRDDAVERSVGNIPAVKTLRANYLNIRDILGYETLVVPLEALEVIEAIWG